MSDPSATGAGPNLYEVLGVAPGTPPEVLGQAYGQRRAQFEAARAGGTDPQTVDHWIAQLDSAYAVLANPVARADYDRQMGGYPPPAQPGYPPPGPIPPPGPQPRGKSGALRGCLLGVLGLALSVGFAMWMSSREEAEKASVRDESGTLIEATSLPASDLRVGDCFQEEHEGPLPSEPTSVQQVTAVPCDEPHDYEMIHSGFLAGTSYPGREGIAEQVGEACLPVFATFIGTEYEDSELEIGYIYPDEASFGRGAKYLKCYVLDPQGPVTGSLEGSAR